MDGSPYVQGAPDRLRRWIARSATAAQGFCAENAGAVVSYDPDTEGFVDTDGRRGVFVSGRPQGNGPENWADLMLAQHTR